MGNYIFHKPLPSGKIQKLDFPHIFINRVVSAASDPSKIAFAGHQTDERYSVFSADTERLGFKKLLISRAVTESYGFQSEQVSWKSRDGLKIYGALFKPKNFDPKKKYPLIVDIHGGPRAQDLLALREQENHPFEFALNNDALVFQVNYRGSTGRGNSFVKAHHRNPWLDADDVITGANHLVKLGYVDAKRIVAQGWSYGGYLAAVLLVRKDHPFAAVAMLAGISDWRLHYAFEPSNETTRDFTFGGTPWILPELYKKLSPIDHVKNARTPAFIVHGTKDPTCNIANAQLMYQALKDLKVPVTYLEFDGMGHGPSKPAQFYSMYWNYWKFWNKYLWNQEIEIPKTLEGISL